MDNELPLIESKPATAPMADEMRQRIDAMTYEDMLRRTRNAPLGDAMFRGETGIYFHARMKERRHALSEEERVKISKKVGY